LIAESETVTKDKQSFKDVLEIHSKWTNSTLEILEIFDDIDDENMSLASLLRLTSILEHSLGNLYLTLKRQQPPHLLKDLLQELSVMTNTFKRNEVRFQFECFTSKLLILIILQIFVLQIILGTSKGLNLRNIAWHGFIASIDLRYITFLLVLIVSYGKLFKGLIVFPRNRPEISISFPFNDTTLNFDILLQSPTIQRSNFSAWSQILHLHKAGKSKPALYLLLSQTESLLRFIYGQLNQVDVTAQLDTYYVIMDSIFYEVILNEDSTPLAIGKINKAHEVKIRRNNKRNKMMENFPSQLMLLGFDVFHAADGPRIRDKMSHGEGVCHVESDAVVGKLLKFVWHVVRFHDEGKVPEFEYESVFMTSFVVAKKHNEMTVEVQRVFGGLKIPERLKTEENLETQVDSEEINLKTIKGFFRPFDEAQIMKLLLNILENSSEALQNFSFSCAEFFQLFNERKLSSTRRETLKKIVLDLPNFLKGFQEVLRFIRGIFAASQQVENDEENFDEVIKLLKSCLKFTENLAKHFNRTTRNFHLANEKTCELLLLINDSDYLEKRKINK
jgi:hypothetical protein